MVAWSVRSGTDMQQLGHTRSAFCTDHLLHTPDTFVRAPLPGMRNATAIAHVGPARGARFTQYTAELQVGGFLPPSHLQRFVYVLEGTVETDGVSLNRTDFMYWPAGQGVTASSPARLAVIEKPYQALPDVPVPGSYHGRAHDVPGKPLEGDPDLEVRCLVPAEPCFDFAVNLMTFQPGASLPMVEMHVMEHGLLMLEGGGIYRLGERWYPVSAGD